MIEFLPLKEGHSRKVGGLADQGEAAQYREEGNFLSFSLLQTAYSEEVISIVFRYFKSVFQTY